MAHVADHLSVSALEQQYRSCTDVTAARHFQTIWLLAKGHEIAEVSATVSYARRWVEIPWAWLVASRSLAEWGC
jgi:tRNA isopentenyl-2-thiomethyl-A-37 hydroxylase MiaE